MPVVDVIIRRIMKKIQCEVIVDIDRNLVREVVVVDNNSKDGTGRMAQDAGATVLKN
jgi:hypothetical protein